MASRAVREWPLVAFTLLSQTAVGALWMVAAADFFIVRQSAWTGERVLTFSALASIAGLLAVAIVFSLFHLGRPWRAASALNNVRRSWLSREILFALVFGGLVAGGAGLSGTAPGTVALRRGLIGLAAIAGVLFLYSMAKIYMLATVPAWQGLYTPLSFFLSAALLGPLAMAVAGRRLLDLGRSAPTFSQIAVVTALTAVILIVLTIIFFTPTVGFLGVKTATLLALPARKTFPFLFLRMSFLAAAVLCLVFAGRLAAYGHDLSRWPALALACAGAAEITGRALFYAAYSRLGV